MCSLAGVGDEPLDRRQRARLDLEELADQQVVRRVVRLHLQMACPSSGVILYLSSRS